MGYEIDFIGVGQESKSGDAIAIRWGNLLGPREQQSVVVIDGGSARFRDPRPLSRPLRLRLQQENRPRAGLRTRHRTLRRPARRRTSTRAPGTGQEPHRPGHRRAAIKQGYRVIYREAHTFLEELAEATLADTRKDYLAELTRVPLLIIDDLGMRKLPHTAAEDLLELIMRRYERASTLLTSNRPVEDWSKLLGDTAAVTALLDRLLHHAHVLKCGPRSWRTKVQTTLRTHDPMG